MRMEIKRPDSGDQTTIRLFFFYISLHYLNPYMHENAYKEEEGYQKDVYMHSNKRIKRSYGGHIRKR